MEGQKKTTATVPQGGRKGEKAVQETTSRRGDSAGCAHWVLQVRVNHRHAG